MSQVTRHVDAVRRLPDRPPWWISGHQLHAQPPTVAQRLLDQLIDAEPERGFFDQGSADWRGFTAFLLASTVNPVSIGGAHGWGVGTATHDSIAVSLNNGGLLAAGNDEARDELGNLLQEWHKLDKPGLIDFAPSFTRDEDGWVVHPQLRSHV